MLGPLRLNGPDGPVRIGSARQRRLLVALAAHAGQMVDIGILTELMWDTAPADPAGAVQTNVSRLRRMLPPALRIVTGSDGYQLLADRAAVDVTAFADLLAVAATAVPAGRPDGYARALALWRGRPFVELDHPVLHPEIARLTALRTAAVEQQATALLAVGRAAEAVAALEALVIAEPLREGTVALLMKALVGAGRQGAALAAFSRLRARLADELGLDPSPELRALERQVLRQEVEPPTPSAVSAAARPPRRAPRPPVSSFVGREAELDAVADLLTTRRVVTLRGPGGVGKTRLALHVAARVADRYDDGVLVVELGDGGPEEVEASFSAALRLSDDGGGPPIASDGVPAAADAGSLTDRIVDVLAVRRQLVLIDNCEHVADEVAPLVEAVARGAPEVDLLLTSREPLRVDGEHVLAVAPLPPDAAAALLTDRLAATGAGGAAEPDAELVAELCHRLDGLPLALELAAGRAATLGLRGLLAALESEESFDVLRGGRRTASARHRSLADVVAWSHGLLDGPQRALFERLAVFAGPVEHAAIVAVCGDATALPDLVERSLVVRHPGEPDRFGMLETLRAFGRSKLAQDRGAAALRARHAAWAVRLADEVSVDRRGPAEPAAVRRFDAHLPDLRRAHAWLCANGPLPDLLRLAVLCGELAYARGRIDLVRLVEEALAAAHVPPPDGAPAVVHPLVPRLLGLLATSDWQRGDLASAEAHSRQAIALADLTDDPTLARHGYDALSNTVSFHGDLSASVAHAERARALARQAGDVEVEYLALVELTIDAAYAGDAAAASAYEGEMVELVSRSGSATARAWLAYAQGEIRAERGDPTAAGYLVAAVRAAEEADSGFVAGVARHTLLTSAARDGDPAAALPAFGPLLDHWHGFGAWTQLWIAVRALAGTLSRLGRHRDVAVLLGALAASPRATSVFGADSARLDTVRDAARAALGADFDAATGEGAALGDHGAVALARRLTRPAPSRSGGLAPRAPE